MTDELSEADRWQERKQHWIRLGLHPSVAGHFAWWYEPNLGATVAPGDWGRDTTPTLSIDKEWKEVARNG